jgi:hypothetical protein
MKQLLFIALVASCTATDDCPSRHEKNEAALIQMEQSWAQALERKDVKEVACILAESFEDASVDGTLHNRDETLAHIPSRRAGRNDLTEMTAHVFGRAGYVRGLNTVIDGQGNPVAKVRFTDIFVYRDGRWKAVAGHETLLGQSPK